MSKCEHVNVRYELMPEGSPHHAKVICTACNVFVGWQKKPATVEREKRNREHVAMLQTLPLTEWQKGFIASIAKQDGKLSPRQQTKFEEIFAEKSR